MHLQNDMTEPSQSAPAQPPKNKGGRPRTPLANRIRKQLEVKKELFDDPLMSLAEFQVATGLSSSTVRKLIAFGRVRVWRTSPRSHMKVTASEIRKFLASGFQPQGGEA
jgi:hypothetical protein